MSHPPCTQTTPLPDCLCSVLVAFPASGNLQMKASAWVPCLVFQVRDTKLSSSALFLLSFSGFLQMMFSYMTSKAPVLPCSLSPQPYSTSSLTTCKQWGRDPTEDKQPKDSLKTGKSPQGKAVEKHLRKTDPGSAAFASRTYADDKVPREAATPVNGVSFSHQESNKCCSSNTECIKISTFEN